MTIGLPQLALLAALVLIVFLGRRLLVRESRDGPGLVASLRRELRDWMPVFSAETTKGAEAPPIRDRLPTRWRIIAVVVVVLIVGALTWLLTR